MKHTFREYRIITLFSFAIMYCLVYLARFNVNNLMIYMSEDLAIKEAPADLISMGVFLTYALGSFINGYLADRYGGKNFVIMGALVSVLMNLLVVIQTSWKGLFALWMINGYFQSMIWVGGISLLANWWEEGSRGKGIGIANFFSGMSHTVAYALPIMIMSMFPAFEWRGPFVIPIIILLIFVGLFALFAKERPEDVGAAPYEQKIERHIARESYLMEIKSEGGNPYAFFFRNHSFLWWCAIAMLSSICRYGLLNWIPLYYQNSEGDVLISETFSNLTLPLGMAFGTLVITWIAGTKMYENKGVIVTAMAAVCGTLVVVFPMISDATATLVGIFITGFVLYGINGILWVHAIDQGCRAYAGTAAGILNGFAYLGAFLEGFIFPMVIRTFHSTISVFVVMEIVCLAMIACGMVVSKKDIIIEPEIHD